MSIASRGATMAVDWEQRIDFARLRNERLEKARASLRDSTLGAVLLFDQNNIRYVSSTHIGEWARDKRARRRATRARRVNSLRSRRRSEWDVFTTAL